MYNIYCITNIINNKKYVGLTKYDTERRWIEHLRTVKTRNKKYPIHHAILKYGEENFKIELLESSAEKERESFWIEKLNSRKHGYNCTDGGDGTRGIIFTEETRNLISKNVTKLHKEQKVGMYGKKHSESARKRISESHKKLNRSGEKNPRFGKKHTEESKIKMRKPKTEETKKKMSAALVKKHMEKPLIGELNPMFGRHHSQDARNNIQKKARERFANKKECEYCHKKVDNHNFKRWHGENCKEYLITKTEMEN